MSAIDPHRAIEMMGRVADEPEALDHDRARIFISLSADDKTRGTLPLFL